MGFDVAASATATDGVPLDRPVRSGWRRRRGASARSGGRPVVRYDLSDADAARVSAASSAWRSCSGRRARARCCSRSVACRSCATATPRRCANPREDLKLLASTRSAARAWTRGRATASSTGTAACTGRRASTLRRQRDPLVARRQPPDHDHGPRDPIGGSPMSFLIDPPWLYANGRARAHEPTRLRSPPARWRFLGRQHPALSQPALDAAGCGACAAPTAGATGCSTPAC